MKSIQVHIQKCRPFLQLNLQILVTLVTLVTLLPSVLMCSGGRVLTQALQPLQHNVQLPHGLPCCRVHLQLRVRRET